MPIEGAILPDDPEALRALIAAQAAELVAARAGLVAKALEIETLKLQIARLRRQAFGRSSEKLAHVIGQLELSLGEVLRRCGAALPVVELSLRALVGVPLAVCHAADGRSRVVRLDRADAQPRAELEFTLQQRVAAALACPARPYGAPD